MKTKQIKGRLLGSAPTQERITALINDFWYSTSYSVNFETGNVIRAGKALDGFRVVLAKGRYRFEAIPTPGALNRNFNL